MQSYTMGDIFGNTLPEFKIISLIISHENVNSAILEIITQYIYMMMKHYKLINIEFKIHFIDCTDHYSIYIRDNLHMISVLNKLENIVNYYKKYYKYNSIGLRYLLQQLFTLTNISAAGDSNMIELIIGLDNITQSDYAYLANFLKENSRKINIIQISQNFSTVNPFVFRKQNQVNEQVILPNDIVLLSTSYGLRISTIVKDHEVRMIADAINSFFVENVMSQKKFYIINNGILIPLPSEILQLFKQPIINAIIAQINGTTQFQLLTRKLRFELENYCINKKIDTQDNNDNDNDIVNNINNIILNPKILIKSKNPFLEGKIFDVSSFDMQAIMKFVCDPDDKFIMLDENKEIGLKISITQKGKLRVNAVGLN